MSFTDPNSNPWSSRSLDPNVVDPDSALEYESELMVGRRCFSTAQGFFSLFVKVDSTYSAVSLHWHGTTVDPNEGSFAVVQSGSRLADLVGEIVRVKLGDRTVFAYVVGEAQISTEITLARRCFLGIGLWAQPTKGLVADSVSVMI